MAAWRFSLDLRRERCRKAVSEVSRRGARPKSAEPRRPQHAEPRRRVQHGDSQRSFERQDSDLFKDFCSRQQNAAPGSLGYVLGKALGEVHEERPHSRSVTLPSEPKTSWSGWQVQEERLQSGSVTLPSGPKTSWSKTAPVRAFAASRLHSSQRPPAAPETRRQRPSSAGTRRSPSVSSLPPGWFYESQSVSQSVSAASGTGPRTPREPDREARSRPSSARPSSAPSSASSARPSSARPSSRPSSARQGPPSLQPHPPLQRAPSNRGPRDLRSLLEDGVQGKALTLPPRCPCRSDSAASGAAVGASCVICLESLQINDGVSGALRALPCGHVFHTTCIQHWLSNSPTCPLCKSSVAM